MCVWYYTCTRLSSAERLEEGRTAGLIRLRHCRFLYRSSDHPIAGSAWLAHAHLPHQQAQVMKKSDQLVGFDMAESVTDGTNGIPVL
jgi:hypothetical protein